MATTTQALYGLKARCATLSGAYAPAAIYVHPDETANLARLTVYPTIIIAEGIEDQRLWRTPSYGAGEDWWQAALTIYLQEGFEPMAGPSAGPQLNKQKGWPKALTDALLAGRTLGGTVDRVGDDLVLMRYQIGACLWAGQPYWGIHCLIPLTQTHAQTVTP